MSTEIVLTNGAAEPIAPEQAEEAAPPESTEAANNGLGGICTAIVGAFISVGLTLTWWWRRNKTNVG